MKTSILFAAISLISAASFGQSASRSTSAAASVKTGQKTEVEATAQQNTELKGRGSDNKSSVNASIRGTEKASGNAAEKSIEMTEKSVVESKRFAAKTEARVEAKSQELAVTTYTQAKATVTGIRSQAGTIVSAVKPGPVKIQSQARIGAGLMFK